MVGSLSYLDMAMLAIPFLLGLLAMWSGALHAVLSIPIRFVVACLLASLVAALLQLNLPTFSDAVGERLGLPRASAQALTGGLIFLVLLAILFALLSRIRARILESMPDHQVGAGDSFLGFVFGAAAGVLIALVLVVPIYMQLEAFVPDPKQRPPWLRDSLSLPLIKRASDATRSALQRYVPQMTRSK
jgi:membrane protein required for colicin V production